MAAIEIITRHLSNNRGTKQLAQASIELCNKVVESFVAKVRRSAVQEGMRSADLGIFQADVLYIVESMKGFYFIFVETEDASTDEVHYLDMIFDDVPSLDYVANEVTFDYGSVVAKFMLTNKEAQMYVDSTEEPAREYVLSEAYELQARRLAAKPNVTNVARLNEKTPISKKIFVVHGHDKEMKEAVARVLMKLGLEPVILNEKPSMGNTIIEKLEAYSDVGYAIILMSPDDMTYTPGEQSVQTKSRARQNVIFELGFFVAHLQRKHVFVLLRKTGTFEMLSDFAGVEYRLYDDEDAWHTKLVRELRAVGYDISADKLL